MYRCFALPDAAPENAGVQSAGYGGLDLRSSRLPCSLHVAPLHTSRAEYSPVREVLGSEVPDRQLRQNHLRSASRDHVQLFVDDFCGREICGGF